MRKGILALASSLAVGVAANAFASADDNLYMLFLRAQVVLGHEGPIGNPTISENLLVKIKVNPAELDKGQLLVCNRTATDREGNEINVFMTKKGSRFETDIQVNEASDSGERVSVTVAGADKVQDLDANTSMSFSPPPANGKTKEDALYIFSGGATAYQRLKADSRDAADYPALKDAKELSLGELKFGIKCYYSEH